MEKSHLTREQLFIIPPLIVVILCGAVAYSNCFAGKLIFDDHFAIRRNPTIRQLWPVWIPLSPPQRGTTVDGRPLVNLSLAFNYAFSRENPNGYHIFNLCLHLANALLLFGILRRTIAQATEAEFWRTGSVYIAGAVAMIWVVHPLTTESVTYITQRAESMVAFFIMLTLYLAIRGATATRRGMWWKVAAVLACCLGMATKEVMVVAPLLVLVYDRVYCSTSWREVWRQRRFFYAGLLASWLILIPLVAGSAGDRTSFAMDKPITPVSYAITQAWAVVRYINLSFWPSGQIFDYGKLIVPLQQAVVPAMLLLGLLTAMAYSMWKFPKAAFPAFCFFVLLAPSSSVVPVFTQTVSEHRMYLPLACVVTLAVMAVVGGLSVVHHNLPTARPLIQLGSVALLVTAVVSLSMATYSRNRIYHSEIALWSDTVSKNPNCARAHYNLGQALRDKAMRVKSEELMAEAVAEMRRAVELDPDDPFGWNNFGNTMLYQGEYTLALDYFAKAAELSNLPEPFNGLGTAYRRLRKYENAAEEFKKAIDRNPNYFEAHYNLALTHGDLREFESAVEQYSKALRLRADPDALVGRAGVQLRLSKVRHAIVDYDRAIQLSPRHAHAFLGRAHAYFSAGQYRRAYEDSKRAHLLGLSPDKEFLDRLGAELDAELDAAS